MKGKACDELQFCKDPQESYEMPDVYIKSGYGKSSVYFDFDKAKVAIFSAVNRRNVPVTRRMEKLDAQSSYF